jgi:hypothetical protein
LEGDGSGFEVFYILSHTEGFSNDSEIDFGSVIRGNRGRWIRLAIEIPALIKSCGDTTTSRNEPNIAESDKSCLVQQPTKLAADSPGRMNGDLRFVDT